MPPFTENSTLMCTQCQRACPHGREREEDCSDLNDLEPYGDLAHLHIFITIITQIQSMILEKLARYQLWADDIARGLVRDLNDEEFTREILPPFGSVQSLCAHITIAIEFNLKFHAEKAEFDPEELGEEIYTAPKGRLLEMWREADMRFLEFSKTRGDGKYVFRNFLGEGRITLDRDDYLSQYLLHTQHHRAQIMSALRLMGKEAKTTDYLFYLSDIQG